VGTEGRPATRRPAKSIPESERFYFLEEWYPKYGNLVPREHRYSRGFIASCIRKSWGWTDRQPCISTSAISRGETLDRKLEGILEIYQKFLGVDPREEPMKVFPGMHYTMGGLWVNGEDQATNVSGIFAAGGVRVSVSRSESAWSELASVVHLWGRCCRPLRR